jgi:hypothetical protein
LGPKVTNTEWLTASVELAAPATGTGIVRVYVGLADPSAAGTAHVDAIRLRVTGDTW